MVNKKSAGAADSRGVSLKAFLVRRLREEPEMFFTGQALAEDAGVSRTAVWKAVKALETAGYPVTGNDRGYAWGGSSPPDLAGAPEGDDFLYPWEFGEKEKLFHHWVSTDSTMNRAAELAARGCPGGSVISAEEQTAGRGRNGRLWSSKKGGLFFTLLERPSITAPEYYRMALAAQIALGKALTKLCGKPCSLRWPNDIYAAERKLAGILTEFYAEGDRITWISLGIGVNVNNRAKGRIAVNCAELIGAPLSRREVLLAFLKEWDKIKADGFLELEKKWNAASDCRGRKAAAMELPAKLLAEFPAKLSGGGKEKGRPLIKGTFLGVDSLGRGVLKTAKGEKRAFWPGAVSFIL
jgi:BirA family biotin operon repressor/biotin-[acetyl-CoA-carboxylase] ligase